MTDLESRLSALAALRGGPAPVISVYLNTRWRDEHQRERVRVFLKNELRRARQAAEATAADLDWVEAEGHALVDQTLAPEASGVALFACAPLGLREVMPVRVSFPDAFVVAERPYLRPLAGLAGTLPATLVVFVDTERARLIPIGPAAAGEEEVLQSEVPGRHRRGGWAQLAQSRYQRHIQDHRGRHFDAVVRALGDLGEQQGADRIVLAGEARNVGVFRQHLPSPLAARVRAIVPGAWHEAASVLVARATEALARHERDAEGVAVDEALTRAAKGELAVAGVEATLAAARLGAVRRLYLLASFTDTGRSCHACDALQPADPAPCRLCGGSTAEVDLGDALVRRVTATGGVAETVEGHPALARAGGLAALLRWPL